MKTINLDKFKTQTEVTIDDHIYIVKGMTVGQYINEDFDEKFNNAKTDKEKVKLMVDMLKRLSNIPEDVLYGLNFQALMVLSQVAQGLDVDETGGDGEKK